MRCVVQRVLSASVDVENERISSIGKGILIYAGIENGDEQKDIEYMAEKIAGLRIFEDEKGAMNLSVLETGGEALVISQFTLLGDCRKGRRPSFTDAMPPQFAEPMYEKFIQELEKNGLVVKKGKFRASMLINSINDGPVTILLDSRKKF